MVKTAGNFPLWGVAAELLSWALLGVIVAVAALTPVGCLRPEETGPVPFETEIARVVDKAGEHVLRPALTQFREGLDGLGPLIDAWGIAPQDEAIRATAQQAFVEVMAQWQQIEVQQVGPTASHRDEIYSYPTVNPCRIDQETTESAYLSPDFFQANNVNSYGLDGLEHLLFSDPGNACPSLSAPNKDGSWEALGEAGVAKNRAEFAGVLLTGLGTACDLILSAWDQEETQTPSESLNDLYDALFYLETTTKDRKLAVPLGLGACTVDCVDKVESLISGHSLRWIEGNILGFLDLFTAGENYGFSDLLVDMGHADLADEIVAAGEGVLDALDPLDGPLNTLIVDDPARVQVLYDALKTLTDLIKGDLATVLTLQIPSEAAGDND